MSNEGEVIASTNKGVSYNLYFGEIFTGDEIGRLIDSVRLWFM